MTISCFPYEGIANFQEDRDALHRVQRNATKLIHVLENKLCNIRLEELNSDYQRESGEVSWSLRKVLRNV